jgi:Flp pilus assembly protein TadD
VLFRSILHGLEPRSRAPEAVASFDRALALRPGDSRAQLARCVLLKAMGDVERAIRGYEQLLVAEPDHAEAHYNLGRSLLDRDPTAALAHFVRGEQLEPNDPDYHLGCARALVKLDRKMEARWSVDRARRLAPDHPRLAELEAALR